MTKDAFFYNYKESVKVVEHHIFLESGRGGIQSIAAWNPLAVIASTEQGIHIQWRDGREEQRVGESLALIEELTASYAIQTDEPYFSGGVIGSVSYDYSREIEKLSSRAQTDLRLPQHYFYLVDSWAVFHEEQQEMRFMKTTSSEVNLEQALTDFQHDHFTRNFHANKTISHHMIEGMAVSMTGQQFEEAVVKIQQYIAQGDVFQVNLSVRQSKIYDEEPLLLYEALRTFNPSPYMAFIQSPDFAIVSGSPELLVKKKGMELSTRPIAGTRPRGRNDIEDQQLADELIKHPKERAEHVMLVDLERNDIGKVSRYGSVFVDEFMVIEKYSHVMHIVSNIRGEIAPYQNATAVIRAMFPGGTITGAPKIRTMEIIEELEPVRRGIYTGSIGWIGYNGDLEMNIVIRTAFIQDNKVHIQAGAGIVIDSVPQLEYTESLNKAKSMWQAVHMVEEMAK
ncbi:anthranilate synthase component I family protein [Kurthia sibirica]|uniref:Aminodeoxychorismate synthase component I n=1 Tax=Kurthia sibirica TaxID=202750 RepID=A0A2U3AIC8_9BACL|nr:anthranilate synthase component I family protein [Kurthia sibirica]PWI24306.1 aminodeoxychorismate synthase component I [Kurthia sibirica]